MCQNSRTGRTQHWVLIEEYIQEKQESKAASNLSMHQNDFRNGAIVVNQT
jgi:hypothetical protein